MKIGLFGGGGYLGSVIASECISNGYSIKVVDNSLFSDEYTEVLPEEVCVDMDVLDSDIVKDYEIVIWSIDIDCENYYTLTESAFYINKNLSVFEEYCKHYGEKLILLTEDYYGDNDAYEKFIELKKEIVKKYGCIVYVLPQLFGPSPRMRFDTLLNDMFFTAYLQSSIYVEDWLRKYPVCSVGLAGKVIVNNLFCEKICKSYKFCNCFLSLYEYAEFINKIFDNNIAIVTSQETNIYNDVYDGDFVDFGEFTIQKSFNYMKTSLEKGNAIDILKDKHNNTKIVNNYMWTKKFFGWSQKINNLHDV